MVTCFDPGALQAAIGLFDMGRFAEAHTAAQALLAAHGERADALNIVAISVQRLGDIAAAERYLRRAIAAQPDFSPAHCNLGLLLEQCGRLAEAVSAYEQALAHDPYCCEAAINLGLFLERNGDAAGAERAYRGVLAIDPDFPQALFNLSNLLIETRRLAQAEDLVRHLLRLRPGYASAHFNVGRICEATGRDREAELAYRAALTLDPGFVGSANNLGLLLHRLGRLAEAEVTYREALRIDSGYAPVWNNLGNLLAELQRSAEAVLAYEKTVALDPDHSHAVGKLLLSSRQICDWSRISALEDRIGAMAAQDKLQGLAPFEMLTMPALSGADHKRVASLYAEEVHGAALSLPPIVKGTARQCGRLRIGYLSSDYCEHATTHLLAGVLEAHDPARAEVFCYSTGRPVIDAGRRRIIKACGTFRDFHELSDEAAARIVAADGIDLLVDLKGYTENGRLGIQARRPAPVVVSWLGYPGTLGGPRLADYVIGDPVVTPLEMAGDYSETLALLPYCYQPNDNTKPIGPPITRAQAGLPDEALVLCNFNAGYKISPAMFALWLEVLRQVPGSVLWLLHTASEVADNLRREAARQHIAPQRLVFAMPRPLAEHLGRLQLADLAVDTFPYTSHTTGSDALWAGVPLATKIGSTFASRVAASLLTNVGLPELIATNDADYLALLLGLVRDRDRLRKVRERLAHNRLSYPLFDTKRFASDLLDLYEAIWRQELRGERKPIDRLV